MVHPVAVVGVYAVVGTIVVHLVFMAAKEPHKFIDVVIACFGAALLAPIPTIGGPLSLAAMLGLLYWRCNVSLAALAAAVALARLAMVPALYSLSGGGSA